MAGVDVFRVLAEENHVDLLRLAYRRRNAVEVAHRAHTGVQVEELPERHVQAADAAADGRRQRALDRDPVVADRVDRGGRQPLSGLFQGLLASQDLEPGDGALARVRLLHSGVHHRLSRAPDVGPDAVALDEGHDRSIRDDQNAVLPADLLTAGWRLDWGFAHGGAGYHVPRLQSEPGRTAGLLGFQR